MSVTLYTIINRVWTVEKMYKNLNFLQVSCIPFKTNYDRMTALNILNTDDIYTFCDVNLISER